MSSEIIHLFLQIFVLIIIGYAFGKLKIFTNEMKMALSGFLLNCALPLSVLSSSQTEFSSEAFSGFIICLVFGLVYLTCIVLFVPKLLTKLKFNPDRAKTTAMMLAFSNSAFMGFPIAQELYGETGLLYAVGYNISFNLILFSLGINLVSSGSGKFNFKDFLKKMITTPAMVASIAGLILYLLPFRLPLVIQDALSSASAIMMPASVLIVGCELSQIEFKKIFLNLSTYVISVVRLIVIPLLTAVVLALLRLDPTVIAVCVLLNAMPAGTTNVILATEYDCAPEFTAIATTQTMIWMVFVTPFIINFVNFWLF